MSEIADNAFCEKFEANVFAKSRCQNCFRTLGAHQHVNQAPEEYAVKTLDCGDGTIESSPCDRWDPLCILAPQCELYICLGSEDRTDSLPHNSQENLEYTQLSSRAEEESQAADSCPDPSTRAEEDRNVTLSEDWEMTRLLDSFLGFRTEDTMYYASQKQEVQSENLRSNTPRWGETASSRSCGRAESRNCLKAETGVVNQDREDSWRKPQPERGYFSLERRKSDPSWVSSPSRIGHSALPVRSEEAGGLPTSSINSVDSDPSWRTSGSGEGRHGLQRQEYTMLADLPKPRRISHREAFEKERSSYRTRSPGRAEVERIFGYERRKAETLEAFQALEDGLLERLDSKTLKLAKEGRLTRRQSSPSLRREVNKRPLLESEQPSRSRREALHLGRPEQRPEKGHRSPKESLFARSPGHQPERESRSRVTPLNLGVEKDRRKREDPMRHTREGASFQSASHGKQMGNSRKSQVDTLNHKCFGKSTENKWKSCLDAAHTATLGKSLDQSQRRPLERFKESDRKARGKPLLLIDTAEQLRKDTRECRDDGRALSPARGRATGGQSGRTLSPQRHTEDRQGTQRETKRALSPGRNMGIGLKSHEEARSMFSPGRCTDGRSREIGRSLSPGRRTERSRSSSGDVRRSPSPGRPMESSTSCARQTRCCGFLEKHAETSWKSQRETSPARNPRTSTGSDIVGKAKQLSSSVAWLGCGKCLTNPLNSEPKRTGQGAPSHSMNPENVLTSLEGPLYRVHPVQLSESECVSPGKSLHSCKPRQQPLESSWKTHGSPTGLANNEWKDSGRCSSHMRLEKELENDRSNMEKLFDQHQLDGGQCLKSVCASRSQDLYLDTSEKHKQKISRGWSK